MTPRYGDIATVRSAGTVPLLAIVMVVLPRSTMVGCVDAIVIDGEVFYHGVQGIGTVGPLQVDAPHVVWREDPR